MQYINTGSFTSFLIGVASEKPPHIFFVPSDPSASFQSYGNILTVIIYPHKDTEFGSLEFSCPIFAINHKIP